jgi:peptidoglycan hydrolase-like protein with peptidoglycan-binding domain
MKIPSLIILVIALGLALPAQADSTQDSRVTPGASAVYDSNGTKVTVRRVQLALQARGYYVGDNRGNYCYETLTAVRRYQRDNMLPMTNKIDNTTLQSLGLL